MRARAVILFVSILSLVVGALTVGGAVTERAEAAQMPSARLGMGFDQTCVVTDVGGLKCWGNNSSGQLGDGTKTNRLTPVDVVGLNGGVAASISGLGSSCALLLAGAVKCWGQGYFGELGNGATTTQLTPVSVSGLSSGATQLTGGNLHACALTDSGGVKCWGANQFYGSVGDGTLTNRSSPVDVVDLSSGVASISSLAFSTCALMTDGAVKCWGSNYYGELGDGTTVDRYTPVNVVGLGSDVSAISVGGEHVCILTTGGGVKCWGYNGYGQLGDGTTTDEKMPVDVVGLGSGVTAIAAGAEHTCAMMSSGAVKCWGRNEYGEVGDGTTTNRLTPTDVYGLAQGIAAVAGGALDTCALTLYNGVKCWGFNKSGQLGDGTTKNRWSPIKVPGITPRTTEVSVSDDSILEGDAGTRMMQFRVRLSNRATTPVTVGYVVASTGSATGGAGVGSGVDFRAASGTITFKPNPTTGKTPTSKVLTVPIFSDRNVESDETIGVTLSNPTGGYVLGRAQATGIIINDDGVTTGTTAGVGDSSVVKAQSGMQSLYMPVTLSSKLSAAVTFNYVVTATTAVYSTTAAGGGDFGGKLTGVLKLPSGTTGTRLSLPIWPDPSPDAPRTYLVTLSSVSAPGVAIVRASGSATIFG